MFYEICVGLGLTLSISRCRCLSETSEGFVFTAGAKGIFPCLQITVLKYDFFVFH